jgi:hypothetical protein
MKPDIEPDECCCVLTDGTILKTKDPEVRKIVTEAIDEELIMKMIKVVLNNKECYETD